MRHIRRSHGNTTGQRGAALMAMLVVMVMGIAAVLVGSLNSSALQAARDEKTADALAQAKEALIGYAITYGDTHTGEVHGYLPCPDIDGKDLSGNPAEGNAKLSCGSKNTSFIGRLPWRTLRLPPLREGADECLWYAISGTYKNNPKTDVMNWDNNGQFEIIDANGTILAQNVVAVILAPGTRLDGQDRSPDGMAPTCGGNYAAGNYLDHDAAVDHSAVSGTPDSTSRFRLAASAQLNDRLIFITKEDIFNALMRRADFIDPARNPLRLMTRKTAECIADYARRNAAGPADKRLPWSGRLLSPTDDYRTNSNYDDETGRLAGRLPYRVNDSDSATANQIAYPQYQLASSGNACPNVADWADHYPWWANWKDHLFYGVADSFRPTSLSSDCGTCLSVNGAGNHAAVVMFAGRSLAGQTRATTGDRLNFANYLEGRNLNNVSVPSGSADYQSATATGDFNDILYCINPDLSVTPC